MSSLRTGIYTLLTLTRWGDILPEFKTFDWAELFNLASVVISFATIYFSTRTRTTSDAQNEQRMMDKLDSLSVMSKETNMTVKAMNKKIDDHAERLARLESESESVFRRLKRIEDTQDHCQSCRVAKAEMMKEGI